MPDAELLARRDCLVFRDKLLLPSEGFIPNHYTGFDQLRPVYVANRFGWQNDRLDAQQKPTATSAFGRALFKQFGLCSALARFLDEGGAPPAVMHAHFGRGGALGLPLAKALGIPLFVTFHGGDATKLTHRRKRLVATIYQRRLAMMHAYASGYLCVSDFVAARLRQQGFPEHKLITHYIGIPLDQLARPTRRSKVAPFLFVGRLVEKKGADNLLSAMRMLAATSPGVRLDIAGTGPEEARLRAMANGMDNVRFLGWQTPEQLTQHLATCNAMLVPSQEASNGDCEGLPTVVLEALRAGVPVIASNHAGIPEIIEHGKTGLIVPERDPAALAGAMRQHLDMGDQVMELVTRGQQRLREDFDAARQSRRLQDILLGRVGVAG